MYQSTQTKVAGQQTNLVANKKNLQSLLENGHVTETLERISTRWLTSDQLKTQAMIAVSRNPALLRCTQYSFLEAMVRASELGLRFSGAGGEAYLVPYKSQCTLIVGYRGLCALARRTGEMKKIEARVVHERDHFKISFGSGQQLVHRPHLGAVRDQITCAYALAELKDGSVQIEVMTRAEIDAIRARSPAGNSGPWQTDYEEMARKTVLRRLCKFLPFPTAFEDALAAVEPAQSDEQPRKHIKANITPDNVDIETGEITGQANQNFESYDESGTKQFENEDAASCSKTSSVNEVSDLNTQKANLINEILTQLGVIHPNNSAESQAARLKLLRYVFGKTVIDEIAKLPVQILEAGLKAMQSQAVNVESNDDLPV